MFLNSILSSLPFSTKVIDPSKTGLSSGLSPELTLLYNAWIQEDNVFTRTSLLRYIAKRRYNPDWPFLDWFISDACTTHPYFSEWFFALASSMSELDDDHFFALDHPLLKDVYFLGRWSRSFVKRGGGWKYYCLEFEKRAYDSWKHAQWLWIIRQNHRLNIHLQPYSEDIIRCMYPEMSFFSDVYSHLSWLDMAYTVEQHRFEKRIEPIDF